MPYNNSKEFIYNGTKYPPVDGNTSLEELEAIANKMKQDKTLKSMVYRGATYPALSKDLSIDKLYEIKRKLEKNGMSFGDSDDVILQDGGENSKIINKMKKFGKYLKDNIAGSAIRGASGILDTPAVIANLMLAVKDYTTNSKSDQFPYLGEQIARKINKLIDAPDKTGRVGKAIEAAIGILGSGGVGGLAKTLGKRGAKLLSKKIIKNSAKSMSKDIAKPLATKIAKSASYGDKEIKEATKYLSGINYEKVINRVTNALGGSLKPADVASGTVQQLLYDELIKDNVGAITSGVTSGIIGTLLTKMFRKVNTGSIKKTISSNIDTDLIESGKNILNVDIPIARALNNPSKFQKILIDGLGALPKTGAAIGKSDKQISKAIGKGVKNISSNIGEKSTDIRINKLYNDLNKSIKHRPHAGIRNSAKMIDKIEAERANIISGDKAPMSNAHPLLKGFSDRVKSKKPITINELLEHKKRINNAVFGNEGGADKGALKALGQEISQDIESYGSKHPAFKKIYEDVNKSFMINKKIEDYEDLITKLYDSKGNISYTKLGNTQKTLQDKKQLEKLLGPESYKKFNNIIDFSKKISANTTAINPSGTGIASETFKMIRELGTLMNTPKKLISKVGGMLFGDTALQKFFTDPKIANKLIDFTKNPTNLKAKRLDNFMLMNYGISLKNILQDSKQNE